MEDRKGLDMNKSLNQQIKELVWKLPFSAELDVSLRGYYGLEGNFIHVLDDVLDEWVLEAKENSVELEEKDRKHVFIFAATHVWIPNTIIMALAFKALGHEVSYGYVPYMKWFEDISDYSRRKLDHLVWRTLRKAKGFLDLIPFTKVEKANIPSELIEETWKLSIRDLQYTFMVEEVDLDHEMFALRQKRNKAATASLYHWFEENKPDVVIVPNGMVFEYGAALNTAKHLGIPVVSYEYGEQAEKLWLDKDRSVMLQDSTEVWTSVKGIEFTTEQKEEIEELYANRVNANLWQNFERKWQGVPKQGDQAIKDQLGLDDRPIALLASNVIGDSLTLQRATFTGTMTEWLRRTIKYFIDRSDVQFVLRTHPGELVAKGPSVVDLVEAEFPELPENVHLVRPNDPVNTYDLISIAEIGLAYTTTVGMEIAMHGVPVIVVGNTHYREKGFTHDPNSWEEYFQVLDQEFSTKDKQGISKEEVDLAWKYAYHFFFSYPFQYPWHMRGFFETVKKYPLSQFLSEQGKQKYNRAIQALLGGSVNWIGD